MTNPTISRRRLLQGSAAATLLLALPNLQRPSPAGAQVRARRGVNVSGAEFVDRNLGTHSGDRFSNVERGTHGVDYRSETAGSLAYLASRGLDVVRVLFRHERLQPTLGGALDATELGRLKTCIANAHAVGLDVILCPHNFAAYWSEEGGVGVRRPLDHSGAYTYAHFADFWRRLASELNGIGTGAVEIELTNEPIGMTADAGGFTPSSTLHDWNTSTSGFGPYSSSTVNRVTTNAREGAGALKVLKKLTSSGEVGTYGPVHATGARDLTARGSTVAAWCRIDPASSGTSFKARIAIQDSGYGWHYGPWQTVTKGSYTQVTYQPSTSELRDVRRWVLAVSAQGPKGNVIAQWDQMGMGSASAGRTAAQKWEDASRQAVTAIRSTGFQRRVWVPTYEWSHAHKVVANHPAGPWIAGGGDVGYTVHNYWSAINWSGAYGSYAAELADAVKDGYQAGSNPDALHTMVEDWIRTAITWSRGAPLWVGEAAWPKTTDTAQWDALAEFWFRIVDAAGVDVTLWAAGSYWTNSYHLGVYQSASGVQDLSVANNQAAILERHVVR